MTHKCIFWAAWLYLRCRPCLRINLPNELRCGVTWTYSWCRFLIKTVPLGSNWCYLRLGRSRMGGKREVRLRWYRGWGDRKHLSNLVRSEIGAAIEPKGLSCAALLLPAPLLHEQGFHLGAHMVGYVWILWGEWHESIRWYLKRYGASFCEQGGGVWPRCEDRLFFCYFQAGYVQLFLFFFNL